MSEADDGLNERPQRGNGLRTRAELRGKLPLTSGGCQAHSNSARLPRAPAHVTFGKARKASNNGPSGRERRPITGVPRATFTWSEEPRNMGGRAARTTAGPLPDRARSDTRARKNPLPGAHVRMA